MTKRLRNNDVKDLVKRITDLATGNPIVEKPIVDPDGSLPPLAGRFGKPQRTRAGVKPGSVKRNAQGAAKSRAKK